MIHDACPIIENSQVNKFVTQPPDIFRTIRILNSHTGAILLTLQILSVTKDPIDFETRLVSAAPRARAKLGTKPDTPRARWSLRR